MTITVDDREVLQHPDIPELLGVPITVARLDAGDYAFLDRSNKLVAIERCEINNFMQKLYSGELEQQLERCADNYQTVMVLVEGIYDNVSGYLATYRQTNEGYWRVRIYPNARYESTLSVTSRLMELGLEFIWTPNFECSMIAVRSIYKQRTKPEEDATLFRRTKVPHIPTKLTSNPAVPRLMALSSRMPEKVAITLINKYGSVWNVIHTEDAELLEIDGVGRGTIRNLKEGLGR